MIHCDRPIEYEAQPLSDIGEGILDDWRRLVRDNAIFSSPFFAPGYTQLVGSCLGDVMVGLLRQEGRVVGIFPYEWERDGHARPVGSIFCDYQGVIVGPDIHWTAEGMLTKLGVESYRFDHMLSSQHQWRKFVQVRDVSWSINLSDGYEAYEVDLRSAKRMQIADVRRQRRMIEKEVGALSFSPHEVDHGLLDLMLGWKSAQWARSGWVGRFTADWEHRLMHRLLETAQPDFAGLFSILRCSGRPVAMHLGMRSAHTWHYWTTAYDQEFKRYSPGLIMLAEMIRHAPGLGLEELDMGKDGFKYKRRLHTHTVQLAEGVATRCNG